MKISLAVLLAFSLFAAACGGQSSSRIGRGRYCEAKTDPHKLQMKNSVLVSLDKTTDTPEEQGLPIGTMTYQNAELVLRMEEDKDGDGKKEVTVIDVAYSKDRNDKFKFTNTCVRVMDIKTPMDGVGFNIVTRFSVKEDGTVQIEEMKHLSFKYDVTKITHAVTDVDPAEFDSLRKAYVLENGQAKFFKRTGKLKKNESRYEIRSRVTEGSKTYTLGVKYKHEAPAANPSAALPADL